MTSRSPRPGDEVSVEILAQNEGLHDCPLTIRCEVSSVNLPTVSLVLPNWVAKKGSRTDFFFDAPIASIGMNYTIMSEEKEKERREYEDNLLATAKVLPAESVSYVDWGGEPISIEEFEENLHECLPSERPKEVFVAFERELTINKLETSDYTADWDALYSDVEDDIAWEGIDEFDEAVKAFHQAIDSFEEKNRSRYSVYTSKMSKIIVADLEIEFEDEEENV